MTMPAPTPKIVVGGPANILLKEGARRLQTDEGEHARHEAEWLLGRLVGATPLELYLQDIHVPQDVAEQFFSHIKARASGIPLQYLLGEAEFFGERFVVRPGVFIPRPETEAIVEAALQALRERERQFGRSPRLLDLGTGSGCIAVTLAKAFPTCVVVGVEVSWEAVCVARHNVLCHGLASRIWLVQGRWGEPIGGGFDGVISNPPYVPSAQVDHLPLDVRQEPRLSLDGGADGMRELLRLMADTPRLVRPGGVLALECGEEQVKELIRAAVSASWVDTARPIEDLAGRPRGVLIRRTSEHPGS